VWLGGGATRLRPARERFRAFTLSTLALRPSARGSGGRQFEEFSWGAAQQKDSNGRPEAEVVPLAGLRFGEIADRKDYDRSSPVGVRAQAVLVSLLSNANRLS
jgi:hypothetical protein